MKDQATAPLPELTGVRGNIIFVQEQGIVPVRSFGTKSFRPDVELQLLVENSSAPFDIQRRGRNTRALPGLNNLSATRGEQ